MASCLILRRCNALTPRKPRMPHVCNLSTLPVPKKITADTNDEIKNKLIYSSQLNENARWKRILSMRERARHPKRPAPPVREEHSVCLKFLPDFVEEVVNPRETRDNEQKEEDESSSVMPISLKVASAESIKLDDVGSGSSSEEVIGDGFEEPLRDSSTVHLRKVWANDYVKLTHKLEDKTDVDNEWVLKYGTSDRSIPSSKVPCGGCGAQLHCKDPSIPGFLPSEVFTECSTAELRTLTCQRCYFLQHHDTSLSVAVDPEIYPRIIAHVKNKNALVLLAVDLTDFPCSIWPGITDIVGAQCPVFLVGNKVDLLWGDKRGWLAQVEKTLRSCFPHKANVIGTQLISAKTGFGVEDLISQLQQVWKCRGDVYLVGCTNVGKSTLFNALLQSDYCKVKAADLVLRATTAPWPGTTLNLLKFPIIRPEGWRVYLRTQRLKVDRTNRMEDLLRKQQASDDKKVRFVPPQLMGHIGRTFYKTTEDDEDPFSSPNYSGPDKEPIPGSGLDPNDPDFKRGRWFYDTPGVLHKDQILDLLTTEELMKTLPQKCIEPRSVIMKPGWTLFVGGLARVDYVSGDAPSTRWTVFVSRELPITICLTEHSDEVYERLLGSDVFVVPSGGPERLAKWPALASQGEFKFSGVARLVGCGDVVLSSCGWISFAVNAKEIIAVRPWTPDGRGIYARSPALLPHAVNLRGVLMRGTPAYSRSRARSIASTSFDELHPTKRSKSECPRVAIGREFWDQ